MTFYDRYLEICRRFDVAPCTAAEKAGLNRSAVTRWKKMPDAMPTGRAIELLTSYFGISASDLLDVSGSNQNSGLPDESVLRAVFGSAAGVTPEIWQEVRDFGAFLLQRQEQ